MFNFITSALINILMLWLDRVTEYFFFFNRSQSIWTRFKKKREYKLFVIKLILIDLQLFFIEHWRDIREFWTDHVYPSRFYWYCWEDAKLFLPLWIITKIPVWIYWSFYWGRYDLEVMFPWDYDIIISEMPLSHRIIAYIYEGNVFADFIWFERPCYQNRYKWYWFILIAYLLHIALYRTILHFVLPFSNRILQRGLDKYPESDRVYSYEWEIGCYYIAWYKNYIIDYNKYLNNWNNVDSITDYQHIFGGLYDRNTRLRTLMKYDRDYLLWRFVSPWGEKPDIFNEKLKRDKAKFKWKYANEFYDEHGGPESVKENIIVQIVMYIIVNGFMLSFLIVYTVLGIVLTPVKWVFKIVIWTIKVLWNLTVYIFKIEL